MDDAPTQGTAGCATHDGAQSTGTCARCGNFVCPLCLDELSPLPDHCEACREREGGGLMPFERDDLGFLKRWWQTTVEMSLRPTRTLESTRVGSLRAAVGFVGFTGFVIGGTLAACGGCAIGVVGATTDAASRFGEVSGNPSWFYAALACAMTFYAVLAPAALIVSAFLRAGVFHLAARLLGGQGTFTASFWSMSYLQGITLVTLPMIVIQQIPLIGPFLGLAVSLAIEVYFAVQLTTVARRYHGLEEGRAAAAGWSVFLTVVALGTLCCLSAIGLALAGPR